MGSNILPTNSGQLIGLGVKMQAGIVSLGTTLKLSLVSAEQFEADLNAFITQDGAFNAQRSARQAASGAFQGSIASVYSWLLGVSNTLATAWGTRWSTQWAQAGFINNTTGIPAKTEDRLGLLLALVKFFTANPSYEVPSQNQTAAYGTTLRTAALSAQTALTAATVTLNTIGDAWTQAYNTLIADMNALIANLNVVLAGTDSRWLSFGLQMPASITTPGQPVNVAAHLDATGAIVVQCDPVPLATRYRFRTMLIGVQQDYVLAASSKAPLGSLGSILPGQTVQIIVQAVNANLQGVASEPIVFTVPLPVSDAAVPNQHGVLSSNGNGNGNGHHHAKVEVKALHPRMA
jgi:hypothetical protein